MQEQDKNTLHQPTRAEAEQLLNNLRHEVSLMEASVAALQFRAQRLKNITDRVGFYKKKQSAQVRHVRRQQNVQDALRRALADLELFKDRVATLQRDLGII